MEPTSELMLQTAPGMTRLPEGFNSPRGLHLQHKPVGIGGWPALASWRNPRGEIDANWVAWRNALIDDPEWWCKDAIELTAPVQWALDSVHVQTAKQICEVEECALSDEDAAIALLLVVRAVSPEGSQLDERTHPARYILLSSPDAPGISSAITIARIDPRGDGLQDWLQLLQRSELPCDGKGI